MTTLPNRIVLGAVSLILVLIAFPKEGLTSSYSSWSKSFPGYCIEVGISVGAPSDRGATEAAIIKRTKSELDAVATDLATSVQRRVDHFVATASKETRALLATKELAKCPDPRDDDDSNEGGEGNDRGTKARRNSNVLWSAPGEIDTLASLTAKPAGSPSAAPSTTDSIRVPQGSSPRFQGVSNWRGVTVRLRLAKPLRYPLRAKLAAEFVLAQFQWGPPTLQVHDISIDQVTSQDFSPAGLWLFRALALITQDPAAARTSKHSVTLALAAAVAKQPLKPEWLNIPDGLLVALWSERETKALTSLVELLFANHYFLEQRGRQLLNYFRAAAIAIPPIPASAFRSFIKDNTDLDHTLHELMKPVVAVEGEDELIKSVFATWAERTKYDSHKNIVRVLTQLGFAQRPIASADSLFVAAAQRSRSTASLPAGYQASPLLTVVLDEVRNYKWPLAQTTYAAVIEATVRTPDLAARSDKTQFKPCLRSNGQCRGELSGSSKSLQSASRAKMSSRQRWPQRKRWNKRSNVNAERSRSNCYLDQQDSELRRCESS